MTLVRRRRWAAIGTAFLAAAVVAALGASMTELGTWYQGLKKPVWQPPDWLFGPAWTLIFALSALAAAIAWWRSSRATRTWIVGLFVLNGVLNILWSWLFFRLQRPDWALIEVVFLWLSILALIIMLGGVSRTAAWLLAPYLIWVTFAGMLNLAVVDLNSPFGG